MHIMMHITRKGRRKGVKGRREGREEVGDWSRRLREGRESRRKGARGVSRSREEKRKEEAANGWCYCAQQQCQSASVSQSFAPSLTLLPLLMSDASDE